MPHWRPAIAPVLAVGPYTGRSASSEIRSKLRDACNEIFHVTSFLQQSPQRTETGIERIVPRQGFRLRLRPAKIFVAKGAEPPEESTSKRIYPLTNHLAEVNCSANSQFAPGSFAFPTAVGRVKQKVAPRSQLAVAHNRPPCDSTIERLIANPMPLP